MPGHSKVTELEKVIVCILHDAIQFAFPAEIVRKSTYNEQGEESHAEHHVAFGLRLESMILSAM